MKIVITGGHLTPALSLIDYLQENTKEEIFFIGREYSQDNIKQKSHEQTEIDQRHIPFFFLLAVRISQLKSIFFFGALLRFFISLVAAKKILKEIDPDVIMSFGGYLALPVVVVGYLLKIPVVTHEQTRSLGMSNKIIAKFAQAVALSYSSSKDYLSHHNMIVTGNPIRKSLFNKTQTPTWLKLDPAKPILYITGGNQGSKIINQVAGQLASRLVQEWNVIHQCGNPTTEDNYLQQLTNKQQQLPKKLSHLYSLREWINHQELGWIYQHADLVISRAGANSVAELSVFHLPTIFIPLPFSYLDEQKINATHFLKENPGFLIEEENLTRDLLWAAIKQIKTKLPKTREKVRYDDQANLKIYQLLLSQVDEK